MKKAKISTNYSQTAIGVIGDENNPEAKFRINVSNNGKQYVLGLAIETENSLDIESLRNKLVTLVEGLFE